MTVPADDFFNQLDWDFPEEEAPSSGGGDTTGTTVPVQQGQDALSMFPDPEAPDSAQGDVVPPPSPNAAQGPPSSLEDYSARAMQAGVQKASLAAMQFLGGFWQNAVNTFESGVLAVNATQNAMFSVWHGDDPATIERRLNRWKYIGLTAKGLIDMSPAGVGMRMAGHPFAKMDTDFLPTSTDLPAEMQDILTFDETLFGSQLPVASAVQAVTFSPALQDALNYAAAAVADQWIWDPITKQKYKKDVTQVTLGEAATYIAMQANDSWFKVVDRIKEPLASLLVNPQMPRKVTSLDVEKELKTGILNPVSWTGMALTTHADINADPVAISGEIAAMSKVGKHATKLLSHIERTGRMFAAGRKLSPQDAALAVNLLEFEQYARQFPTAAIGELPRGIESPIELVALKNFREKLQYLAENSNLTYEQYIESLRNRAGQYERHGPPGHKPKTPPEPGPPPPVEDPIITPPPKEPIITPPPKAPLQQTPAEMEAPVVSAEEKDQLVREAIRKGHAVINREREEAENLLISRIERDKGFDVPLVVPGGAGSRFGLTSPSAIEISAAARTNTLEKRDFTAHLGMLRREIREAGKNWQHISGLGNDLERTAEALESKGYFDYAEQLRSFRKNELFPAFEGAYERAVAEQSLEMDTPQPLTETGRGIQTADAAGPAAVKDVPVKAEEPGIEPAAKAEDSETTGAAPQPRRREGRARLAGGRPKTRKQTQKQKVKEAVKAGEAGKKALKQEEVQELSRRMAFNRNMLSQMPPGIDRDQAELELNIMNQALENRGKVPASLRRAVDEILNKPRRGPLTGPGAASPEEFKKLNEEYRMFLAEKFGRAEQMIRAGEEPLYHHTDAVALRSILGGESRYSITVGENKPGIRGQTYFTRTDITNRPYEGPIDVTALRDNFGPKNNENVRLVTTRQELRRRGIKPFQNAWGNAEVTKEKGPISNREIDRMAVDAVNYDLESLEKARALHDKHNTIPVETILKIEIDPSVLMGKYQFRNAEGMPADLEIRELLELIKMAEDKGIPTVIRPLFQQRAVHEFRPILPPVVEKSVYKSIAGADEATNISLGLAKVAKETDTVAEAAAAMANLKTSLDSRTGGAIADAGIDLAKETAESAGKKLADAQVPGMSESTKEFLPRFRVTKVIEDPTRLLPAPNPMASMGPDVTGFGMAVASPSFVLDDARNPVARGIYRMQRWGRYLADKRMGDYADHMIGVADIVRKSKNREAISRRLFDAINTNAKDAEALGKALAGFSAKEKDSIFKARRYLERFVDANGHVFHESLDEGISIEEFTAKFREWDRKGLLEKSGFIAWGPDDFYGKSFMDQLKATEVPVELVGENLDNSIFSRALPGLKGQKDIIASLRVLGPGVIRQEVWRPIWKDMAQAAENLPPRMSMYVDEWIKAQRGVKSRLHQIMKGAQNAGRFRLGNVLITPGEELSGMLLTGFYKGALYGNVNYYLANFLGQGVANSYADKGPFAAFEGIARHFQRSFDGVNRDQLLGGFDTWMGRDLPRSPIADEAMKVPGVREARKFLDWVEDTSGPTQSEFINRSIGMHIGLQEAIDNYNFRNGTNVTWKEVLDGKMGEPLRDKIMFEALQVSDRVNFVYGVDGSNPILRNDYGRGVISHVGQFLSFIPKQTEFFGKALKRDDPGVIIRYLTAAGWLSSIAAKGQGIDLSNSFYFGSAATSIAGRGSLVGPSVQALAHLLLGIAEQDPIKQEQRSKDFTRTVSMLIHPGFIQRIKTEHALRQMRAARLLSPDGPPWETLATWGPEALEQHGPIFGPNGRVDWTQMEIENEVAKILASETIPRVLGLPVLSDRQERLIYRAANKIQAKWRLAAKHVVEGLITEMQLNGNLQSPKAQELLEKARQDGWPIDGMMQNGMLESSLPRMLRFFENQSNWYKRDFFDQLKGLYPEVFENPPVMPYTIFDNKERTPFDNPGESNEELNTLFEQMGEVP